MKTALTFLAFALASATALAQETPAVAPAPLTPCEALSRSLYRRLDSSALELMDRLEKENRISDDDLTEYDRIRKPAMDAIAALKATCEKLDAEQRATLVGVFGAAVQ